jgi:hypothetical protein
MTKFKTFKFCTSVTILFIGFILYYNSVFYGKFIADLIGKPSEYFNGTYALYANRTKVSAVFLILLSLSWLLYQYLEGSIPVKGIFFKRAFDKPTIDNPGDKDQDTQFKKSNEEKALFQKDVQNMLSGEIQMTRKNLNVNLSIGVFTTAIAIFILYETLIGQKEFNNANDLYKIVPRFSIAIFVELFSFFFLRLYRKNLDDIKYLTNEITTFESKQIALTVSQALDDRNLLNIAISELSRTERNHILKKGETTVDLQKMKVENTAFSHLLDKIAKLFTIKNPSQ